MTVKELRRIKKRINFLYSKAAALDGERFKITQTLSFTSGSGGESDKIGALTAEISALHHEAHELEDVYENALSRLSRDIFEENCLYMHYVLEYSWTKIALKVGGNNSADSIKKMCYRHSW